MKQLAQSYSYNSGTRVLTLTGVNVPQGNLVSIYNATVNKRVYSVDQGFIDAISAYTQASNSAVTLRDGSGFSNSDIFNIVYDDGNTFDPVRVFDSSGTALTYASTGTAGTSSSDVVSIQGITGATPVIVSQSSATSLKTQSEVYQGGTAVSTSSPLQVSLANTGVNTTPLQVRPRNASVTVTANTTSATANTSAPALTSSATRQYLLIQNISDTDMYFNFGATATTSHLLIKAGGAGITFESGFVPTDEVNVICSAASKSYYILSA
jgi:type IV secretory pathway VirJ component